MISNMSTETIAKKLFTVDEYYRMWEVGILPEDGRFELIRGEVMEMPLPGRPHRSRVNRLNQLFSMALGKAVIVSVQNPLPLDRHSVPMPDLALLRPRPDFYTDSDPALEDILLIVEVSHTTVSYDKNVKAPLYAAAGIGEYWQLDLESEVLIVRTDPLEGEYLTIRTLRRGDAIRPQSLPDVLFHVDEMIG